MNLYLLADVEESTLTSIINVHYTANHKNAYAFQIFKLATVSSVARSCCDANLTMAQCVLGFCIKLQFLASARFQLIV